MSAAPRPAVRVLFANHTGLVSGAEHSLLTLIAALPRESVAGLACPEGELAEKARAIGITVYPIQSSAGSLKLHPWRTPRALIEFRRAGVGLRAAAVATGASVIHANSTRTLLVAALAGRRSSLPPVVTHERDCLPSNVATRAILKIVSRRSAAVVATTQHVAERFATGVTDLAAIEVVFNPVDLERFDPVRLTDASRAAIGQPLMAIVGQITEWKGHDTAIRALALVRERHPQARLLIVGEIRFADAATRLDNRSYLESLHRLVAELGLDGAVEFAGQRNDVPEILAGSDILLLPSIEEPFGRSVAEAMVVGTPVIATSVGGPAELIEHGRTGLLAAPGDASAWARAIEQLVDDPRVAATMAAAARSQAVERFAPARHAEAMLAIFTRAAMPNLRRGEAGL